MIRWCHFGKWKQILLYAHDFRVNIISVHHMFPGYDIKIDERLIAPFEELLT